MRSQLQSVYRRRQYVACRKSDNVVQT